ncbi:MAG: SLBB domain-containing protein [Armatimonadota bacterium]|nr:SLBB domain-containing protein [Armatimonadota bacterium]
MRFLLSVVILVSMALPAASGGLEPVGYPVCGGPSVTNVGYVAIIGEVKKPGRYPFIGNMTVRDAVQQAGGFGDYADLGGIYLVREQDSASVQIRINWSGKDSNAGSAGSLLKADDIVVVKESETAPVVIILGEVSSPGRFPLKEGMTLIQAIAVAGGVSECADASKIVINRFGRGKNGKAIGLKANLGEIIRGRRADPKLLPGDILIVPKGKKPKPLMRIAG